jgi:DNA-binding protein Fis
MAAVAGNQSEAARRLGISRVGLIKKLARLGLK